MEGSEQSTTLFFPTQDLTTTWTVQKSVATMEQVGKTLPEFNKTYEHSMFTHFYGEGYGASTYNYTAIFIQNLERGTTFRCHQCLMLNPSIQYLTL